MPQQEQSTKVSPGDAFGLIYLFAACHAAAITPIIRSRHGPELWAIPKFIAMVMLAMLSDGKWKSRMGVYFIVWFAFLVYRRIETFNNWRRGIAVHSHYVGDPWLAMKFRFIKDEKQARAFEPIMCLLLGAALAFFSPPVGFFVMAGFVSLGLCMAIEHFVVMKRVQRMNDAAIEGEHYAEEFRRIRG